MKRLLATLAGAWRAARALGPRGLAERQLRRWRDRRDYRRWIGEREPLGSAPPVVPGPGSMPLLSVLMPTHDTDPRWLKRAIDSVRGQSGSRWELCIADDASSRPGVLEMLAAASASDPRIRVAFRPQRGHISAASNSALELARGEFVALLDHDDELAPDALARVSAAIGANPSADVVYSDEDKLDSSGRRIDAYFKPDFSPDLLLSHNLVSHLGVYRTALVREVGGFREGFEGSQDHDLVLRVLERSTPERVVHVPRVLYHWRTTPGSTAGGLWRKDYAHDAGSRAIAEHLERTGRRGRVERTLYSAYRVRYALPDPVPAVAVIRGVAGASALNDAVRRSRGDVVLLLGPRCEPLGAECLDELVSQASRPEVGVAGGRVLSPSRRVLHAGYLLDLDSDPPVLDAHHGLPAAAPGHFGRANLVQNLLAVSADCLAMRREVFDRLGGFDERAYPRGLFEVDLCLRCRELGLRVLFTPFAAVVRRGRARDEDLRLGDASERQRLRAAWRERLPRDPYWHPAMDRRFGDFRLCV